jgi:hypothetical protein
MIRLLRFRDLQTRGIIPNWPTLKARVRDHGFPPGRKLGPNSRAWTEDEVDAWIASRPNVASPARGVAKTRRGRPRKAESTTTATTV